MSQAPHILRTFGSIKLSAESTPSRVPAIENEKTKPAINKKNDCSDVSIEAIVTIGMRGKTQGESALIIPAKKRTNINHPIYEFLRTKESDLFQSAPLREPTLFQLLK